MAGRYEFRDLNDATLELFCRDEVFLDWWVSQQREGYRAYFDAQLKSLKAAQYVPSPVLVASQSEEPEFIAVPNALSIRPLIEDSPMAFGVVGRGGTGKTTLLGRIGIWAMEADPNRRLLSQCSALPVLIRKKTVAILDHVTLELKKGTAFPDENFFSPVLIKAALRKRRLILLIDGLSELDAETVDAVGNVFGTLPVALLCFSSRRSFPEVAPMYREINPQELKGADLNRFVSQYILLNKLRDRWSPLEELAISQRLIELLQKRAFRTSLPALFVKLVLDTYDSRRDPRSGPFPVSLAEAVQRFVRDAKVSADAGVVDAEQLVEAATDVAFICLGPELTPRAVDGALVRTTLAAAYGENANRLFKDLVDGNILIADVSPAGLSVGFSFDPVAEYLAAAGSVKQFGLDVTAWRRQLDHATASANASLDASGYLEALLECIIWARTSGPFPEIVEHIVREALTSGGTVDKAAQ
jgi:hypothetical protein